MDYNYVKGSYYKLFSFKFIGIVFWVWREKCKCVGDLSEVYFWVSREWIFMDEGGKLKYLEENFWG